MIVYDPFYIISSFLDNNDYLKLVCSEIYKRCVYDDVDHYWYDKYLCFMIKFNLAYFDYEYMKTNIPNFKKHYVWVINYDWHPFVSFKDKNFTIASRKLNSIPREILLYNKITSLDLRFNNLKKIPKEIFLLPNIKELDIGFNFLQEIPKEVALSKLETLDISTNNIKELPKELALVTTLKRLSVSTNKLNNIDQIYQLNNIQELFAYRNNLKNISKKVSFLTNAEILYFNNNEINSVSKEISLLNLDRLDLTCNKLTKPMLPKEFYLFNFDNY